MDLKYRERQILQLLLSKKSVYGNELSEIFNISSRTIRNDIKNINALLKKYQIEISSNNYIGYFLNILPKERELLNDMLHSDNTISKGEPEYREKYILINLIRHNKICIDDLADELYISTSSILSDLKRIEQKLASIDREFSFDKKGSCYSLEGRNEKYIRLYLSLILIDKFNESDIGIISYIIEEEVSFEKLKKELFEVLNKENIVLSDHDIMFFCIYVIVSIIRNRHDYFVEFEPDFSSFKETQTVVSEIVARVSEDHSISFSKEEIYLLNELYRSFNTIHKQTDVNINLMEDIKEISKKIDKLYGTTFAEDNQFLNGITAHLDSYLNKRDLKLNFSEGIIKELKQIYSFAYNLSIYLVDLLNMMEEYKSLEINENEMAFISIHFQASMERHLRKREVKALVVCSYGIGTTKLLETQLKKEFSNMNILATVSSFAYELLDFKNVDLIIVTTPLNTKNNIPMVEVEVPLSTSSIEKIKSILKSKYYWLREIYPLIMDIPEDVQNEEECFIYISGIINYIENKNVPIEKKLMDREKILTTNIGRNIAMPHALFEEEFMHHLYFFRHKKGISWGKSKVNLVATILISAEIKEYMNEYMKLINHIYENLNIMEMESLSLSQLIDSIP
jgi:lichenan operon transcriptional antiterminator